MIAPLIIFEPIGRRVRIEYDGTIVADSLRAMLLIERGRHPYYYLPEEDFIPGCLRPSARIDTGSVLGPKRHWSLSVNDATALDAVHGYDEDAGDADLPALAGYRGVAWDAVRWFEEDEEIFRHPRNPYARVDTIRSSRQVTVKMAGRTVAETRRAVFLFETGNITRYYMPIEDVDRSLLRESDLTTYCPYKGTAHYYHLVIDGIEHANLVWTYPDPYDESEKIRDLLSFYNEKVEAVLVDGEAPAARFPARI